MQTYQEWMTENPTTIVWPEQIDEATQNKIKLWFKYREVADDDRFGDYFQRVLDESAVQYEQLLRIEPGITQYDWLVSRYTESQRRVTGTEAVLTESGSTVTHGGTVTTQHGHKVVTDHSGQDTDTLQHGETITREGSEGISGGTVKETGTIKDDSTKTSTRSGGQTRVQTDTRHVHDTQKTTHDGDTVVKSSGYTVNDKKTLEKANPMSISYPSGTVMDPVVDGTQENGGSGAAGETLDWSAPSAQGQTYGRDIDHSETSTSDPDITVARESYVDPNGQLSDSTTYDDLKDDQKGSSTRTLDTTKTTTYNKITSGSNTHGGTDTTTRGYASQMEEAHSGIDTVTRTLTDGTSGTGSVDRDTTSRDRYQQTGRSEAPADILRRAVVFITGTNAWQWLKGQLEVCFICIYD